jgi:hypothetical protein
MRLKMPTRAIIDQVRITCEGNDAIIDYADSGIAGTRLTIGPDLVTPRSKPSGGGSPRTRRRQSWAARWS